MASQKQEDRNKIIEKKSMIATKNHLENMEKLANGESVDYDYLDSCWICGKPITFFDGVTFNVKHSFEGNAHRRDCLK